MVERITTSFFQFSIACFFVLCFLYRFFFIYYGLVSLCMLSNESAGSVCSGVLKSNPDTRRCSREGRSSEIR